MYQQALDDAVATIQQILDRDYTHLEWRVLSIQPARANCKMNPSCMCMPGHETFATAAASLVPGQP